LDISAARIVTERGAAIDSFYVSDADGVKIVGPERREQILPAVCARRLAGWKRWP